MEIYRIKNEKRASRTLVLGSQQGTPFPLTRVPVRLDMAFSGLYIEVTPHTRIVWTNEESADGAASTVTLEEKGDKRVLILQELYPSKQALADAIESGSTGTSGAGEQFELLDELLLTLVK